MSPSDKIEESTAPLIEHLTELRQRLIYSVLGARANELQFGVRLPRFKFFADNMRELLRGSFANVVEFQKDG